MSNDKATREAPGIEGHFAYVVGALRMGIGTHGDPCFRAEDGTCPATSEFREAIDRVGKAKAAADALKAQNAELVEALEKVLSQAVPVTARCGCCGHSRHEHAKWCAVPFARAALAKAGGK